MASLHSALQTPDDDNDNHNLTTPMNPLFPPWTGAEIPLPAHVTKPRAPWWWHDCNLSRFLAPKVSSRK